MVMTDVGNYDLRHPRIKLPENVRPPNIPNETCHDRLLAYLIGRLKSDETNVQMRSRRFARIDKMVSTWQRLSKEDVERQAKQEATGEAQAISMNLPIQQTHMDDMVSFFSSVYAPVAGSFYEEPTDGTEDSEAKKTVIQRMNGDAKAGKYYKELCLMLRGLFKYNIGGFAVEWKQPPNSTEGSAGRNTCEAIDMYNFYWDPAIDDPSDIPLQAEWAGIAERKNRMWIIKKEQANEFYGAGHVLNDKEIGNGNIANFYRYPPNSAGLGVDGKDSAAKGQRADWDSYGAALPGDSRTNLDATHEIVTMYCHLNPSEFGLRLGTNAKRKNEYVLFRFTILDSKRIIAADVVQLDDENPDPIFAPKIPYYLGYLNQDDMGAAQRSIAELLSPFQAFGSFLLNAHVAGARSSIYGLNVYDPEMIDMSQLSPSNSIAANVPSKQPNRDVRTALQQIKGTIETGTMDSLARLVTLMQQFFPVQALPSQIAGMERAVTSQVAAVMQGVNRRLHMLVRVMDSDILGPARFEQFMNITRTGAERTTGLTERDIHNMLGSGLAQLNREAAAQAMQQLLFAIIQNPKSAEQYDVMGLINYWSKLMNQDTDLTQFQKQVAPAAGAPPPQAAPTQVPPNG